jgi:hypothetical protein
MSQLQTIRTVQIYDGVTGETITVETGATKWSDIIPLIEEADMSLHNRKAVLRSTKGILQLPDALVPEGNQVIYLVQDKMKSGATKDFENLKYNELRKEVAKLRETNPDIPAIGSNPKTKDLIAILTKYTGLSEVKGTSKVAKEKRKEIKEKVEKSVKENTPDLLERIEALESTLGTLLEGFSEVLNNVFPKQKMTKEEAKLAKTKVITNIEEGKTILPSESKLLSEEDLAKDFKKLGL